MQGLRSLWPAGVALMALGLAIWLVWTPFVKWRDGSSESSAVSSSARVIGPIMIGDEPTMVDIGDGRCIYRRLNRDLVKLVDTDGAINDSRYFWYQKKKRGGAEVEATFATYPITDTRCVAVRS